MIAREAANAAARRYAAGARNFLTDMLGSTIGLADSSGTLQTQYNYDPFGNVTASGSPSGNSYQFTGRENDGTGLDYYRARYYSSTTQRLISQDPLEFGGGDWDLYSYAGNQPVNLRDPSGTQTGLEGFCEEDPQLCDPTWWWGLGAGAAGAAAGAIAGYCSNSRPGRWSCKAQCQVVEYSRGGNASYGPIASGTGNTESSACQDSIGNAKGLTPLGSYPRHCSCFDCEKR